MGGEGQNVPQKRRSGRVYLVYHINKVLSVVPTEVSDDLNLILVHQCCFNQRGDFVWKEGTTG